MATAARRRERALAGCGTAGRVIELPVEAAREIFEFAASRFGELELTADDLRRNLFDDPGFRPEWCLGRFGGARLEAAAVAVERPGGRAHLKILEASAGIADRGQVFDELFGRIAGVGMRVVRTDGAAPVYLRPGAPARDVEWVEFLRARGFRSFEQTERVSMTVDLAAVPDASELIRRLAASGVELRRAAGSAVDGWIADVRDYANEDWEYEIRHAAAEPGAFVDIAVDSDRVVGFAVGALWARNAFGPLAVHPDWSGRSVGTALAQSVCGELARQGVSTGLISWVGPEAFYRRAVGAVPAHRYHALELAC